MTTRTAKKSASAKAAPQVKRVAIACQGGGSHTAFTGGVLQALLRNLDTTQYRIEGFSGTSGGALCAAIAWYGLLQGDPEHAAKLLESFWHEMATNELPDAFSNQFLVWLQRSAGFLALPEVSPYQLPSIGQEYLASIIARHINFSRLPALIKPDSPDLLIGAVEILSGAFTVFHSRHAEADKQIALQALLPSAASPEPLPAVHIGKEIYWDGLFSENPPIRDFIAGGLPNDAKPDEIWVIRINPEQRKDEPKLSSDITDRRNELGGNLSLNQELFFVEQTNKWLAKGWLTNEHFKHIAVRHIPLELELDYPSKLDRRPALLDGLLAEGQRAGLAFLHKLQRS